MDILAQQFGCIPFLVEILLSEKSETISDLYSKMTNIEKMFLFDRKNVPLDKIRTTENIINKKLERIRKKHDRKN